MHKIESRETSNRKYLSKTILACRSRQAKKGHGEILLEALAIACARYSITSAHDRFNARTRGMSGTKDIKLKG